MANSRQAQTSSTARQTANEAADTVKEGAKSFSEFIKKFYNDWSLHLTQALTFVLVTSLIPLGMLLAAIVGQIIGTLNPSAQTAFIKQLSSIPLMPSSNDITRSAIEKVSQNAGVWIIVSIIVAIFLGSRLFTLLEACFDIIYHVPQRPFKQKNKVAIIMVFVFMLLTPLLVLTSLLPEHLVAWLQHTPVNPNSDMLNKIAGVISSFIVSFLLFEIIYVFVPNRHGSVQRRIRSSLPGSITAAIVLQLGLLLFPLYTRTVTNGVVGQIAFALVFLLFFYVIALVILIGATVNAYYSENIRPPANDLITRVSRSN